MARKASAVEDSTAPVEIPPTAPPPAPRHFGPVFDVLLEQVDDSPMNPRRGRITPESVEDLRASIRSHGVLQPLLVRPNPRDPARYELVFGHRRAAAARLEQLAIVPARCEDLGDRTVLELQLEENLRRSDLHPMEEAEGYQRLVQEHGQTADSIAARVGKSKAYVYARLKLCALTTKARAAFLEGKLDASVALLVARVPGAKLQDQALAAITPDKWDRVERLPFRQAAEILQRDFMLQLAQAPFDTGDAELVKAAGACGACPKRTGNQRELFGDVKGADVCTDPACFKLKTQAAYARVAKDAEHVIDPKKAAKLFHGGHLNSTDHVDVDAPRAMGKLGRWDSSSEKSLRQLLKKDLPQPSLAQDDSGAPRWLLDLDTAKAAARKAGLLKKTKAERDDREVAANDRKARERQRARLEQEQALEHALARVCAARLERFVSGKLLDVLEASALQSAGPEAIDDALEARGVPIVRGGGFSDRTPAVKKWLAEQDQQERARLALELFLVDSGDPLKTALRVLGVTKEHGKAELAKMAKAKPSAKPEATAKPAKRKA